MRTFYQIAIFSPLNLQGQRNVFSSIFKYARRRNDWRILISEGREGEQELDVARIGCDGILATNRIPDGVLRTAEARGIPVVMVEPHDREKLPANVPYLRRNSTEIGRFAADYFLKRSYTSFAYVDTNAEIYWSAERREGFRKVLSEHGYALAIHRPPRGKARRNWADERPQMIDFLRGLPKPTAVFAAMDGRARLVLDACAEAGIKVPGEIAVLGVDNDRLLCESTTPPLSSIDISDGDSGAVAADMLMRLIQGRKAKSCVFSSTPRIVERQSTGYEAMKNPTIAAALAFVNEHAETENISVADVVSRLPCSRRYAEILFQKQIGHSIRDEILRIKMEHVCTLLRDSNLPLGEIALRTGFSRDSHLSRLFKEHFGVTMRKWRQRHAKPASR